MGNWISVYTDEMDVMQNIIRSRDNAAAGRAIDRYKQKAGTHAKEDTITAIEKIIQGAYKADEHSGAHNLIYAFEHLCRLYARHAETVEISVDEEKFPEIFDFVWKSDNDPFGLPSSKFGSPACAHWNNQQVKRFVRLFSTLDIEKLRSRTDSDYRVEVDALCGVLRAADDSGQGVFVFFNE